MKLVRITTVVLMFVAILFLHGLAHAAYAGSSSDLHPEPLPKLGHPALEQILWRAANFPGEIVAASEELPFTADGNAVATAIRHYLPHEEAGDPATTGISRVRGVIVSSNSSRPTLRSSAPLRLSKRVSGKLKRITIDWSDK